MRRLFMIIGFPIRLAFAILLFIVVTFIGCFRKVFITDADIYACDVKDIFRWAATGREY